VVDVVERTIDMPINGWPNDPKSKRIGQFLLANAHSGLRAGAWQLLRALNWAPAEIEEFVSQVKEDWMNPNLHIYYRL
jgi:hypothetical protein